MEIGKFYMKEKNQKQKDILWQITVYDNYQIDVHPFNSRYEIFKHNCRLIKQSLFNSIPVTEETTEEILEKKASIIINAHKKYIEENGLENPVYITREEDKDKPIYIG